MFNKVALLAVLAPLASALSISAPSGATSAGSVTINWSHDAPTDPAIWSLELINTIFRNNFAIANNVDDSVGSVTLTLPAVPVGDGYTLQAVNVGNLSDVYATSAPFSIGATISSSTSSGSSSTSSAQVISGSIPPVTTTTATTSGSGQSTTAAGTSSAPAGTSTPFNAASSLKVGYTGVAAMLLTAVAGAAVIVL